MANENDDSKAEVYKIYFFKMTNGIIEEEKWYKKVAKGVKTRGKVAFM